jgi:hypothetical protein
MPCTPILRLGQSTREPWLRASDPFDRADRIGFAQGRGDRVQAGEVVDLDVDDEGVEIAIAVGELNVDDVGVLVGENARNTLPLQRRGGAC